MNSALVVELGPPDKDGYSIFKIKENHMDINYEIKAAMFTQNRVRLNALRALKNALSNAALQGGNINQELSETEIINVTRKQIKQRQDSIALFIQGGRDELAEKERVEIAVLEEFLPKSMDEAEIDLIIDAAMLQVQATTKRDMGKVMKIALERCAGRVDNKVLSAKIGAKLL